jgi:hypothetical protein
MTQTADERLAVLENRMDSAEMRLNGHDTAILKINEAVSVIKETLARVATKDDIVELTKTINERHTAELRDAHNSVPTKVIMIVTVISGALGLAAFALAHFHG